MIVRKIFRTGNSLVISLPKETTEFLGFTEGSEVSLKLDEVHRQLIIEPFQTELPGINEVFTRQVNDFIEKYRPALEALAQQ